MALAELYARAVAVRPLEGGVSAQVEALELEDGRTLVVRRHRRVADELPVLQRMELAGVPVPQPHFVEDGALVMDFVDGVSGLEVAKVADGMAAVLHRIHAAGVVHGDYWAGNTIWRDGTLVAVLDWEDAHTGDPLADVGNARLELLWSHGAEEMEAFTRAYGASDTHWDRVAAERLGAAMETWGLDAETKRRMRAQLAAFVG